MFCGTTDTTSIRNRIELLAHGVVHLDDVTERLVAVNGVAVCATVFRSGDVARLFELGNDSLNRAFGNANAERDLTQPYARTPGQTD